MFIKKNLSFRMFINIQLLRTLAVEPFLKKKRIEKKKKYKRD